MARSFRKEIKEPDSFQLFAEKAVDWYQSSARAVLGSAVAVVVVVGAIVGYIVWSAQVRERAGIALAIAETASKNPLSPETENAMRLAADGYPGTKPGIIARLRLAALLAERGDTAPAEKEYRRLLEEEKSLTETDREIARRGLAGSLGLQGKCADAVPIWRDILAKGSILAAESLYLSIGGCLEETGRSGEALKAYEELIQKHPSSPYITSRLRAQMARLGGGK